MHFSDISDIHLFEEMFNTIENANKRLIDGYLEQKGLKTKSSTVCYSYVGKLIAANESNLRKDLNAANVIYYKVKGQNRVTHASIEINGTEHESNITKTAKEKTLEEVERGYLERLIIPMNQIFDMLDMYK